jgi:8-oxo-dGTP pyrophosphatase MutT (NUDIX family)
LITGESLRARKSWMRIRIDLSIVYPRISDAGTQRTLHDSLIRRTDNGNWAAPGGAVDLGESLAQAAVRETLEESGIECGVTGIVGIYF